MDAQETFGQLRSLLHLPAWSEETSSAFLALVESFKKRHASFFRTQCLPYIEAQPLFQNTMFRVLKLKDLERYARLLPKAQFEFQAYRKTIKPVLNSSAHQQIKRLSWCGRLDSKQVDALVRSPTWENLRQLVLWRDVFDQEMYRALNAPWCQNVTHLEVLANDDSVNQLPSCLDECLDQLISLKLSSHSKLDGATFRALASSSGFERLRYLDISSNHMDASSMSQLAVHAHALTHLNVGGNPIGSSGMQYLLNAPWITQLEALQANNCALDAEAFDDGVLRVRHLALINNPLEQEGLRALLACLLLDTLEVLDLTQTQQSGDVALHTLADHLSTPTLRKLYFRRNHQGNQGCLVFRRPEIWRALTLLDLEGGSIDGDGIQPFLTLETLPALASLYLHNNQIGDQGARLIAASSSMAQLKKLHVGGNGISDSVKRVLRKSQHVQDALYPIFS